MSDETARNETTIKEPSEDELSMALCAIRYCMGRATYIVADGIRWARHYGAISPWLRGVLIKDLESSVAQLDRARTRGAVPQPMSLGHDIDEREWRQLLGDLRDMEASVQHDREGSRTTGHRV